MKFRNQWNRFYCNAAGSDGGEGGSGGDKPLTQADIDKAVEAAVTGLKNKNGEVIGSLKKAKEELARFDGIDPEAVRKMMDRMANDEEAKMFAEGKYDEVFAKRTERLRGDYDQQLSKANDELAKAQAQIGAMRQGAVHGQISKAAAAVGVLSEAIEDVAALAMAQFSLSETGEAVAVDKDGETILGKDGKSPLTPSEWIESFRETKPYFFPRATGGGLPGSKATPSGGIKRSEMSAAEMSAFIQEHGQDAYLKLAK